MKKKRTRNYTPKEIEKKQQSIARANERWLNKSGNKAKDFEHPWAISNQKVIHLRQVELMDLI